MVVNYLYSYSANEAASYEQTLYRFKQAPQLFLGCFKDSKLVGMIMATASSSSSITQQSMSVHDPNGKTVCIHSVCVAAHERRQGIAKRMIQEYLKKVKSLGYEKASLIVHECLVPLYAGVGFKVNGISPIVHGTQPWIEMNLDLE